MSTLRVDNIKSRTGSTVTIPESNNLTVTGGMTVTGVSTYASGSELKLQNTNINAGTRGDILYYGASGAVQKLNVGASGAVIKSDGTDISWGAIGGAPNIYYVATSGVDAAGRGGSVDTAWKTIKYACQNIGTPTSTAPAIIFVKGGVYEEIGLPIVVPPYTTIAGDSLRTTVIKPGSGLDSGGSVLNTRSTLFRLSNGTIVQDCVCDGMGGYTVGNPAYDPTVATLGGIYFALNSASAITEKSPYIYNVTTFGDGATGAYIDGSLHGSGYKTMLFHTYTAIHSDGLGIWAKDNGSAEVINCFSYYCQLGYCATGGAQVRSLNSSNSYGEYGVFSKGYDSSESANQGAVDGTILVYTNVLASQFTNGEQIQGATSNATAYVINVQSEPKHMYIVQKSGTFQAGENVVGQQTGVIATLDSGGSFNPNQSGRILVTTFATSPTGGDSLQFASVDGNAYQIQTVTNQAANSVTYRVLVFSTSRATPVPHATVVNARKRFSTVRLTGHDFLKIGTGDKTTTNWPGEPTQPPSQADQIITNTTDPGRVYYVATDELGNFYVGEFFSVDQATGKATLNSSAFDLSGLESLQLGAIGGLIGASVNEFSTDGTLSQNSDNKVPTQAAVRTYVGATTSITPSTGTLTVAGNLTVNGTQTTVNTTNTTVTDGLFELANGTSGSPTNDTGIIIERGSANNAFIGFDESEDKFTVGLTTHTGSATGNLTITTGTLVANVEGTLTGNSSTASNLTGTPNISVGTIGCGNITSTGEISDSLGDIRRVVQNAQSGGYTLVGGDAGKHISTSSGGVTVPSGVFAAGQIISVYNNTSGSITITQGGSVTLRWANDGTTGNRTLGTYGLATILCTAANNFVISGGGLS